MKDNMKKYVAISEGGKEVAYYSFHKLGSKENRENMIAAINVSFVYNERKVKNFIDGISEIKKDKAIKLKELLKVMRNGDLFVFDAMTGTTIAKRISGEWHFKNSRETLRTIGEKEIAIITEPYNNTNSVFVY